MTTMKTSIFLEADQSIGVEVDTLSDGSRVVSIGIKIGDFVSPFVSIFCDTDEQVAALTAGYKIGALK